MEESTPANNNNCVSVEVPKLENDSIPQVKVTQVTKLRGEETEIVVSSGGEDEEAKDFQEVLKDDPTWSPPPVELETKMRELLEHYFSDENLVKDKFLLKHVKRNRLGYVSVKLLTSFKKLKNLSRSDWRITAYCIVKSKTLELNRPGTKVRRREPLPEIDLPTTSIKTLLYKLPEGSDEPTIEGVSEQFKSFGELTTVRIIRPSKEVPVDLRNHTTKHPELGTHTCVVIEFESTDAAQNAYKTLSKQAREDNKPEMYSLLGSGRNPRKQAVKGIGKHRDMLGYDSSEDSCLSSRENSPLMARKFVNGRGGLKGRCSTSPLVSPQGSRDTSPDRSYNSKSPRNSPKMQRKNKNGSAHSTPSGSPWFQRRGSRDNTPDASPRGSPAPNRKQQTKPANHQKTTSPLAITNNSLLSPNDSVSGGSTPTGGSSPWLQRRRQFVASQGNSPATTPGSSPVLGRKFQDGVPLGVARLPRGPPNSNAKGFQAAWKRKLKTEALIDKLQQDVKEITIVN
uniref:La-related protein 6 n=1 Tax=Phallusia mammillata TaxID=59560 RepID=A0A6F9DJS2_9ASCI|nr:la-related protein 6 [Phallusia mammillata]